MRKGILAMGLAVAVGPTAANALEPYQEMRPYFSGMYSHVFEHDDRDDLVGGLPSAIEEGHGLQLGIGKSINKWLGIELSAFGHNYSGRNAGGPEMQDYGAKIDGLFFYRRDYKLSPYFAVGAGGIRTTIKDTQTDSTDPFADVGLGVMKFFEMAGKELGLRIDMRYRHIFFDEDALGGLNQDDAGEAVLNFGLVMPLGPKPLPPPAPPAPACLDADGDGVCDNADLCPDTPEGREVDAKGCPVEKPTPNAQQKFEDVHFAFDRSELSEYAQSLLDHAAAVIGELSKVYPSLKVNVAGHTDSVGTDGYNQGLSERRANAVKRYLHGKGVDPDRIETSAYGEARPKATNENEEGRALNRRAEVRTREK